MTTLKNYIKDYEKAFRNFGSGFIEIYVGLLVLIGYDSSLMKRYY